MRSLLLVLIALLLDSGTLAAQTILPQAAGLEDSATRVFTDTTDADYGLMSLVVRVASFDTAGHASGAIPSWFQQTRDYGDDWDSSRVRPIGIRLLGDETQAMTGLVLRRGSDFDDGHIALVAVRVDATLYLFETWTYYSDPVGITEEIARITLGVDESEVPPVPNIPYKTGGLWDALPRIEDLPIGMTWEYDTQPCVGLLATTTCEDDATPAATPAGLVQ